MMDLCCTNFNCSSGSGFQCLQCFYVFLKEFLCDTDDDSFVHFFCDSFSDDQKTFFYFLNAVFYAMRTFKTEKDLKNLVMVLTKINVVSFVIIQPT